MKEAKAISRSMRSHFITNYTDNTFLATIQANLRSCKAFYFTVSFIKKAGLVLLTNDIKSAIERGVKGKLITSTYQNFTFFSRRQLTANAMPSGCVMSRW